MAFQQSLMHNTQKHFKTGLYFVRVSAIDIPVPLADDRVQSQDLENESFKVIRKYHSCKSTSQFPFVSGIYVPTCT